MRRFIVTVQFPAPLIGCERVEVQANTHAHATLQARRMRADKGWPRHSTYTPRLVDHTSYARPALLAPLAHPEALSTW